MVIDFLFNYVIKYILHIISVPVILNTCVTYPGRLRGSGPCHEPESAVMFGDSWITHISPKLTFHMMHVNCLLLSDRGGCLHARSEIFKGRANHARPFSCVFFVYLGLFQDSTDSAASLRVMGSVTLPALPFVSDVSSEKEMVYAKFKSISVQSDQSNLLRKS